MNLTISNIYLYTPKILILPTTDGQLRFPHNVCATQTCPVGGVLLRFGLANWLPFYTGAALAKQQY